MPAPASFAVQTQAAIQRNRSACQQRMASGDPLSLTVLDVRLMAYMPMVLWPWPDSLDRPGVSCAGLKQAS